MDLLSKKPSQLEVERLDRNITNLRNHYEKETGKEIKQIDVCDLTDFIKFYGGNIEYADLEGGIKSIVVKEKEGLNFTIVVANELEFENYKKRWIDDYKEASKRKNATPDFIKHAKEMIKKGPSRYLINMELTRAFGNYVLAIQERELEYLTALPTFYDSFRFNPTKEEINNSIETAKNLVISKNK